MQTRFLIISLKIFFNHKNFETFITIKHLNQRQIK